MDTGQFTGLVHSALFTAAIVAAPVLIICLIIGVVISIFQAATQIHEQSLSFVPKLIAVLLILLVAGNWMVTQIIDFTQQAFNMIANLH